MGAGGTTWSQPPGSPDSTGLAYCRHLSTVRTHLSALVHHNIIPPTWPPGASGGLTKDVWSKYQKDEKVHTLGGWCQRPGQGAGGAAVSAEQPALGAASTDQMGIQIKCSRVMVD